MFLVSAVSLAERKMTSKKLSDIPEEKMKESDETAKSQRDLYWETYCGETPWADECKLYED